MNTAEKILIVDDEVNILTSMKRQLRGKFVIDTAEGGQEALDMISTEDHGYLVVITDMNMPGMNGLELLKSIKSQSPDTIRIMLTGNADQDTAKNAVNDGEVFRFMTKPCQKSDLVEVIEAALECYRDRKKSKNKIEYMQQHVELLSNELLFTKNSDTLTALPNRTSFEACLKDSIEEAKHNDKEYSLCYFDIDQFRVINEVCGHDAGDDLLLQFADTIRENIRKRDILARLGGDEFVLLLKDCSKEKSGQIAQTIKAAIENLQFFWDSKKYSVSTSIGIASSNDTDSAEDLLKLTSSSCSYAKLKGRNCIYTYSAEDVGFVQHNNELQWVNKINEALDEDRFQLYYQPIIHIGSGNNDKYHYEILLRMLDKTGHIVMPNEFLPTVEKYNFARKVDRWVIDNLFWWLSNHSEHLANLELCSINLSGDTLSDDEIYKFILHRFNETDIPPEKICFEVTETATITNFDVALKFIESIKRLGCRISLDDFGSGLSSFAYLKKLPVDHLKIDGQFVKNIVHDRIDYEIVKSINDIGHALDMKIIAEYVEDEAILMKLSELKVDYAQGYGIGKPLPLDEFQENDLSRIDFTRMEVNRK